MNEQLTVGSLFSGIGGFDLGFERAGMRTLWFCEQDAYCQRVLAKHWPGVPCYPDVRALVADTNGSGFGTREPPVRAGQPDAEGRGERSLGAKWLPVPVPYVDVLCGGFPCQDISLAGRGGGIADGSRSGLWREFARLIGELRPRYVVVENVPAITSRGLDIVLADLAARGLDAEWDHLPASAFGAPHRRDRFWLVAYPGGEGRRQVARGAHGDEGQYAGRTTQDDHVAGGACAQRLRAADVADSARDAAAGSETQTGAERQRARQGGQRSRAGDVADAEVESVGIGLRADGPRGIGRGRSGDWLSEPDVGRVADGIPARVDRLRSLGNALVPQIAEWIGQRIVSYEAGES